MRQSTIPIVIAIALLAASFAEATTVVTLRFHDEIWIAADSRLLIDGAGSAVGWCKIKNFGDIVLVNAGRSVYQDARFPGIAKVLQPLLLGTRNASTRIREFTKESAVFQPNPAESKSEVPGDAPAPLAFIFGFFENGLPVVEVWQEGTGTIARDDGSQASASPLGIRIRMTGQRNLIESFLATHTMQALYHEIGIGPALDLLIKIQARGSPGVMDPVDIFRLTADGGEWIQKKQECREREPVE